MLMFQAIRFRALIFLDWHLFRRIWPKEQPRSTRGRKIQTEFQPYQHAIVWTEFMLSQALQILTARQTSTCAIGGRRSPTDLMALTSILATAAGVIFMVADLAQPLSMETRSILSRAGARQWVARVAKIKMYLTWPSAYKNSRQITLVC